MIIALAGRRIDADDAEIPRFPLDQVPNVYNRLKLSLIAHKATMLVCSGACGADLIALDVAGELKIRRRMVLPFHKDRFRSQSVTDRPGEWGALFDKIYYELVQSEDIVILNKSTNEEESFALANQTILDEALNHAYSDSNNDSKIIAILVWEGNSRGEGDMTAAFADEAIMRGIEVQEVLTL